MSGRCVHMVNYIHVLHLRAKYKIDRRGGSKNRSLELTVFTYTFFLVTLQNPSNGFNANLFQITLGNKMAETGWTRPKQSFKLKKNNSISGKPPPLRREVVNNGLYMGGGLCGSVPPSPK